MMVSASVPMINLYVVGFFVAPYLWIVWRRRRNSERLRVLIG